MAGPPEPVQSWRGKHLSVRVLHSVAGVAQQIGIADETGYILVDAGDGVVRDLLAEDRDISDIHGVLFTHGHFDHVGGLHSLLGFLRMIGRTEPLQVVAPEGCREVFSIVRTFEDCYADTLPYEIVAKGMRPGEEVSIASLRVKSFPLVHCGSTKSAGILGPVPAMGYRIGCRGESVAVSGDTGDCPSLRELVKEADLAVLEATYPNRDGVDSEYLEKVHLAADLAAEIGGTAKSFLLVHRRRSSR